MGVPSETLTRELDADLAELTAQPWIRGEAAHLAGQIFRVERAEVESRAGADLAVHGCVGGDDRHAARHRLDHRHPKGLDQRGEKEDVSLIIETLGLRAVERAHELYPRLDLGSPCQVEVALPGYGPTRTAPGRIGRCHEAELLAPVVRVEQRQSAQRRREILVLRVE